jgi:hypothetical protein
VAMKAPDIASALMSGGGVGLSAGSAASALASTNQNLAMAAGLANPAAKMAGGLAGGGGMAGGAGGNALRTGIGQVAGAVQGAGARLGKATTAALSDPGQQPSAAERLPGLGRSGGSGGVGQRAGPGAQHGLRDALRQSVTPQGGGSAAPQGGSSAPQVASSAPHSGGFVPALETIAEETEIEIKALPGTARATLNTAPAPQGAGASGTPGSAV